MYQSKSMTNVNQKIFLKDQNLNTQTQALLRIKNIYISKQHQKIPQMLDYGTMYNDMKQSQSEQKLSVMKRKYGIQQSCNDTLKLQQVKCCTSSKAQMDKNFEEQDMKLQELEDKIQTHLELNVLDLSKVEMDDIQNETYKELGSMTAINRCKRNMHTETQHQEYKRLLQILNRHDPKIEIMQRVNDARSYSPKRTAQDVLKRNQEHIPKVQEGFGPRKIIDYINQYDKQKKQLVPANIWKEERYLLIKELEKKHFGVPKDKQGRMSFVEKSQIQASMQNTNFHIQNPVVMKQEIDICNEKFRVKNSKLVKDEIRQEQIHQQQILQDSIKDQLQMRKDRKQKEYAINKVPAQKLKKQRPKSHMKATYNRNVQILQY